jgi:nitrogen regulatory protein P-II 2
METTEIRLLTIVAEEILRDRLIDEIRSAGAKGFTLTEAAGEGSRHRRVGDVLGGNIKLEVLASPTVADRLLSVLASDYFPQYAVIAYVTTVGVVRGEHYA